VGVKWRKWLIRISAGIGITGGAAALFSLYTIRRSFPQVSGTITLSELSEEVTVRRDSHGIPHIYASNDHDLFFAQGYVHAQDRFWQMDFWRHLGAGRLAEMFGESEVSRDKFLRTLGWERVAQREWEQLPATDQAHLQAYADGVNAYLAEHQGSEISLEYAILSGLNPDYEPQPWQPIHTLTWGKVMAWDLAENMEHEINRAILLKTLTPDQIDTLFPPYPEDHPIILPDYEAEREGTSQDPLPLPTELLQLLSEKLTEIKPLLPGKETGLGSNSWVVDGTRTATGKPLLANDPHLGIEIPSIWYQMGLHCLEITPDCQYDVSGFSFPSVTGIIIGHNAQLGWGTTATVMDVMDLYIEKINPDNPNQYEYQGEWVDMEIVEETIEVAGADPVSLSVRYTRHGPIISDTYQRLRRVTLADHYALSLRWTALEPSRLVSGILGINRASNWQEFRQGAKDIDIAAQNLVYGDIEGNIGYQMPGNVPIRTQGQGRYPVPGWTGDYEWEGYIPFAELPSVLNPERGYIVTANNPIVDEDYPYLITKDWNYGYRAQRILRMLENQDTPFTIADFQRMQGDNKNLNAEALVPILLQLEFEDTLPQQAQEIVQLWDFQNDPDAAAPAIFEAFWRELLTATFDDDVPPSYAVGGGSRMMTTVHNLIAQPSIFWWDNQTTEAVETRDEIFRQAFTQGINNLTDELGDNPETWEWGDLHTVTFPHQSLGQSGIAPIEALFNRGSYAVGGGSAIVNANSWNVGQGFEVTAIPSMRMILDFSNFSNSVGIHSTGQSGHAYHPHYTSMIEPWQQVEYFPMRWGETVRGNTTDTLTLIPE
jgi:penicillin amidase